MHTVYNLDTHQPVKDIFSLSGNLTVYHVYITWWEVIQYHTITCNLRTSNLIFIEHNLMAEYVIFVIGIIS